MGYRSDVRIVTSKKGFKKLNDYVKNYLKDKNEDYNLLEHLDFKVENSYEKYFGWNGIKWYDGCEGYEEVTAIVEGLSKLTEDDFSYRFARIGESYDDYETYSYESEREEEQDLEYPSFIREFDDEYTASFINQMDEKNNLSQVCEVSV